MLITVMLHFMGVQILTALSGEKLSPYPLMRKLCLSCHREIVSMSMNLDENLCIQGQHREARIPQVPAHYQVSFVPGIEQNCKCTGWNFLDSQGESQKPGYVRIIVVPSM